MEWPRLVGAYLGLNAGLATITVEEGHLALDLNGAKIPLQMHAPHIYFGHAPSSGAFISVGFKPPARSTSGAAHATARYLLVNGSLFERIVRDPDFRPDPALLANYAGAYTGETGTLFVRVEQDALVVRSPEDDNEARYTALGPMSFVGSLGVIEFLTDETGQVTGLTRGRFYPFRRVGG